MKTHKKKKSKRMRGHGMGTHGGGARKKRKGSGHRGGKGMAGTGKRADQKKTLITKLYGHKYFGKQGITSKGTKRDKRKRINLRDIELNLEKYGKKTSDGFEIELSNYKILGEGEVKNKLIIKVGDSSKSARKKVEAKGGKIILIRSSKNSQTNAKIELPARLPKRQPNAKEASKSTIEKVKKAGGKIEVRGT